MAEENYKSLRAKAQEILYKAEQHEYYFKGNDDVFRSSMDYMLTRMRKTYQLMLEITDYMNQALKDIKALEEHKKALEKELKTVKETTDGNLD